MKSKITLFIFMILITSLGIAQSQNSPVGGGEFIFNPEKIPCLNDSQREAVMVELKTGIQELKLQNRLAYNDVNRGSHPFFIWPVKKKDGLEYNSVWGISNYVDHNSAFPNQVLDYNCEVRTYDTASGYNHKGVDIFNWPFQWKMMDNDEVEIIAAAEGQILAKAGSYTDRSCSLGGGNWNFVYIQHADGSVAVYGHLKQNSVTTKNPGDMVAEGEYLGIVGSSGNSSGPHLHFEVYSEIEWEGVGTDVLVDPYVGTCNNMNADTWWQDQKPHNNPNINAALTHTAPPVFPTCPTQEITNESDTFDASDTIYFAIYMRDQVAGTSINIKILKPDNTVYVNFDFGFTDNYYASYWYWNYANLPVDGEWKWEVTYQGQTVTHIFNVGTLSVAEYELSETRVYPNPFNDNVQISTNSTIIKANVFDLNGRIIKTVSNKNDGIKTINLERLSNGIYFLTLESDVNQTKTIKLIKK